ncbi:MAG TPA: thrombospondin type 3 repeat-containing protein, partial [Phototrophicaceae bacterium]|nr:thrombospondin type 3 repeat-containing protein [Phototrophicaceae bacterium]
MKLSVSRLSPIKIIILMILLITVVALSGKGVSPTLALQCDKDRDCDGVRNNRDNCPDEAGPESNGGCPTAVATPIPNDQGNTTGGNGSSNPTPVPTEFHPTYTHAPAFTVAPTSALPACPQFDGDFQNLDGEVKEFIETHPELGCNYMEKHPVSFSTIAAEQVNIDCPEKLPWYIHNQYQLGAEEDEIDLARAEGCGESAHGQSDKQLIRACLAGENITRELVKTIVAELDAFGLTPLEDLDFATACEAARIVRWIGFPTRPQKGFYDWLPSFCRSFSIIDRLNYVYIGLINGADFDLVIASTRQTYGETIAEGLPCPELTDNLIDPLNRVDPQKLREGMPEQLQTCDIPTLLLYENRKPEEPEESLLLCQEDACQAVRNYIRTGFIPLTCPAVYSPVTSVPEPVSPTEVWVYPGGAPLDDTTVDAVLIADAGDGTKSGIFGLNYRPGLNPSVWVIPHTEGRQELYPSLNLSNQMLAYLETDGNNQNSNIILKVLKFKQKIENAPLDLKVAEGVYPLAKYPYQPLPGSIAWDSSDNLILAWENTEDKTENGIYLFSNWKNLDDQKMDLLIKGGRNPAVSKSSENSVFIVY